MILKFIPLVIIIVHVLYACEQYSFKTKDKHELQDHVISTITTPFVEICWDKCVWTMNCLSINVRNTIFGTVECDLNNSSNKASPDSFKKRKDSQYHEMQHSSCQLYECKLKKAMEDGWFRYSRKFTKLFVEKKPWTEARAHCLSLGGDLLSIKTQYESDFYHEVTKLTPKNTSWQEPTPWIGYNAVNSTEYMWSDGTRIEFSALMPASDILVQKCVTLKNGTQWFAANCQEKMEYFCEKRS